MDSHLGVSTVVLRVERKSVRYTYVASWSVIDGVGLPKGVDSIELQASAASRFVLTRDPDSLLEPVDRSVAYRDAFARGFMGENVGDLHAYAESRIPEIAEKRRKRRETLLVQIAGGEVEVEIDRERSPVHHGCIILFEAIDKDAIAQRHEAETEAMKTALALESRSATRFRKLTSEVYLTTDDGVTVRSFSQRINARLSVMTPLGSDAPTRVDMRYRRILESGDLETVRHLTSLQGDAESDLLRQFLYGWAALEVFVHRAFKANRCACEELLRGSRHGAVQRHCLGQDGAGRGGDASSLSGRFASVAALVFPDAEREEGVDDYDRFCKAKTARDGFYHGDVADDADLPVSDVAALLSKYLRGYLESKAGSSCGLS